MEPHSDPSQDLYGGTKIPHPEPTGDRDHYGRCTPPAGSQPESCIPTQTHTRTVGQDTHRGLWTTARTTHRTPQFLLRPQTPPQFLPGHRHHQTHPYTALCPAILQGPQTPTPAPAENSRPPTTLRHPDTCWDSRPVLRPWMGTADNHRLTETPSGNPRAPQNPHPDPYQGQAEPHKGPPTQIYQVQAENPTQTPHPDPYKGQG
ncbi:hypothetical protein P7K49_037968 [Saguinus oedipus]|uniref:Uncharacterized protein n=1 Tax=Saguinus oedipus TaxID=9490 RepID=A0ABQ9TES6_SAGOE|nr:hypothetical protein P7K49_037968 [Saguinus oedipus]